MDMDLGRVISEEEKKNFKTYYDVETRLYIGNSRHDMIHGCFVAGADEGIHHVEDNTLIYGNMQDESYFIKYLDQVKQWLKVKPEYDSYEYSRENLCIINMRGGEYTGSPELFMDKKYWVHGIKEMKKIRPDMEFMIITDDVETARKVLPGIPAYHFDIGKDYGHRSRIFTACFTIWTGKGGCSLQRSAEKNWKNIRKDPLYMPGEIKNRAK